MLLEFGTGLIGGIALAAAVHGSLTLLELSAPRGVSHPLRVRIRGAKFWLVSIVFYALTAKALYPLWHSLGVEPILKLHVASRFDWAGPFAGLLISLALILFIDFFGYWFHRLQHGPLWRFHAVHHSIEEMNAVNSYGHVTDEFFRFFAVVIPMSLIPFGPHDAPLYLTIFLLFQVVFLHTPTRLHYGPLGLIFADNRYHRIHHSLEPRHFEKNYGTLTTVWDRVFGTAYFPAKGEWPATGLAEMPEPRTMREYLDLPLRYGRRSVPPQPYGLE